MTAPILPAPGVSGPSTPPPDSVTTATIVDGEVMTVDIDDGAVTDAKVAAANKDGADGVPSMRTLGTGAGQAAAGTHGAQHTDGTDPLGAITMPDDTALAFGAVPDGVITWQDANDRWLFNATHVNAKVVFSLGANTSSSEFAVWSLAGVALFRVDGAGLFDFNGSDIDLDPTGDFDLSMDLTRVITLRMADNQSAALRLREGANDYLRINTLNGSELLEISACEFAFSGTDFDLDPTGDVTLNMDPTKTLTMTVADDLANALLIEGAGSIPYISVKTSNGTEQVEFGNTTTNPIFRQAGTGQVAFNGNVDIWLGLDVRAGNITHQGGDIDLDPTGDFTLDLLAGKNATITMSNTSALTLDIGDALATAFKVTEEANGYLVVDTTNGSEVVTFGNATTNPNYNFEGSGAVSFDGPVSIPKDATSLSIGVGGDLSLHHTSNKSFITNTLGDLVLDNTPNTGVSLIMRLGSNDANTNFEVQSNAEVALLTIDGAGSMGFFGAAPAPKPDVSGSRAGNAALADLLTELATLGLITDSSS